MEWPFGSCIWLLGICVPIDEVFVNMLQYTGFITEKHKAALIYGKFGFQVFVNYLHNSWKYISSFFWENQFPMDNSKLKNVPWQKKQHLDYICINPRKAWIWLIFLAQMHYMLKEIHYVSCHISINIIPKLIYVHVYNFLECTLDTVIP